MNLSLKTKIKEIASFIKNRDKGKVEGKQDFLTDKDVDLLVKKLQEELGTS